MPLCLAVVQAEGAPGKPRLPAGIQVGAVPVGPGRVGKLGLELGQKAGVGLPLRHGVDRQAVDLAEGLHQSLAQPGDGEAGAEVRQIPHPGPDRGHPLGLKLQGGDVEVPLQRRQVHRHHEGAVVVALVPRLVIGVAGELLAVHRQVVTAVLLCRDAQGADGLEDDLRLPGHVIVPPAGEEGEVQVPQVVVNRPTTGQTADKMSAVCFQSLDPAFVGCVLVAPDDHGALVLPQVEDLLPRPDLVEEGGLQGQVAPGVGALCGEHR